MLHPNGAKPSTKGLARALIKGEMKNIVLA